MLTHHMEMRPSRFFFSAVGTRLLLQRTCSRHAMLGMSSNNAHNPSSACTRHDPCTEAWAPCIATTLQAQELTAGSLRVPSSESWQVVQNLDRALLNSRPCR
mmetsp:Transcript_138568/g.351221  ORF Transcript_138568/g.351221 Transcript_138568/m.351221 type:complete len:102 (-) Transcript_138568:94-399(-)